MPKRCTSADVYRELLVKGGMSVNMPLGLYIHVPFCLSKCPYCDFYSVICDEDLANRYTDAVCRAIAGCGYSGRVADTVYFGGGTPVLLGEKRLGRILETAAKHFKLAKPEITLEANPSAALEQSFAGLKAAGFNRVSIGIQSGNDKELDALGRIHDADGARASVIAAEKAGFANISADLMLGIPHQTAESLMESIDFLMLLPLTHISAYMLKIEPGTPFAAQKKAEPDEDTVSGFYLSCVETLAKHRFMQYEISNFAKAGFASRHNLKYWQCGEYLGIGPSAHSYIDGERFYFPRDLDAFLTATDCMSLTISDGRGGSFEEYAMLRLRLTEGLNLKQTAETYGIDTSYLAEKARALERNRLVETADGVISLTPKGFLLSNAITAHLLY